MLDLSSQQAWKLEIEVWSLEGIFSNSKSVMLVQIHVTIFVGQIRRLMLYAAQNRAVPWHGSTAK